MPCRLLGCLGEQEAGGLERLPDTTGGIEPWREGERDRIEVEGGGRDPCPLEQGRDAGPRVDPQAFEPESSDGAILADDRSDIGDGAERREVGQVHGHRAEQELRDLEGNAASGEPRIGILRIRVDAGSRPRRPAGARAGPGGGP